MSDSVLVIGGGIAGVQAALDLADSGARVVLVERAPSIGGKMAALDKNFPTLDCSICIEAPKLSEVGEHPNIEILSRSEVVAVEGSAGDFRVRIRQKAGYVTSECTRCDLCAQACPVVLPNEFDSSMASRKAIYTPFPQAVPGPYLIDMEHCLNEPPNYLPCARCKEACGPKCITFDMPPVAEHERRAAAIVVATGYDFIDPTRLKEYGYGRHPDILTAMEFERLLTSAGPTGGEIIRPSDGSHPHRIHFVLCVGSRDRRFYRYCSRFCCMYSIKHAFQAMDHGVKEITVLYMDLRAYGKGFDAFLDRTRLGGAKFIRGRPAAVVPENGHLRIRYEATEEGRIASEETDLVVLATAVRPPEGLPDLARVLGVEVDEDGFLKADEARGALVSTSRPGIYAAGCTSGPKDIPDSVAEAGAAAAASLTHLAHRTWPVEPEPEPLASDAGVRTGVFVCHCGSNIAGTMDVKRITEFAKGLPYVVHAENVMFACAGNTQNAIAQTIREKGLTRLVVSACSPKTHEGTFKRVCLKAGLNPYLLEMVNLRNHGSWVHKAEKEAATRKGFDMVEMGVQKARFLRPLDKLEQPVVQTALVVGGGIAGMTASVVLARQGYETHLVEREPKLGGMLCHLDELAPSGLKASALLEVKRQEVEASGVHVHLGTEVEMIGGHIGNYTARLSTGEEIRAGAVILAMGARAHQPAAFSYGQDPRVVTNLEMEGFISNGTDGRVTLVGCVGSRQDGRGCSRYCCQTMIHQALRLRRQGRSVRVLYRDIRTFSRHAEEAYEAALREGVQFFRYGDRPPEEAVDYQDGQVRFHDDLLGREVVLATDLLVLSIGLTPQEEGVSSQLKVSRSEDGFLLEKHPKLGPAEAGSPGIYLAGVVQAPKDVRESIAQAMAAAAKAGMVLAKDTIEKEPICAQIIPEKCNGCGLCVEVCPFNAIEMLPPPPGAETAGKKDRGKARVITAACQACGTCAAACNRDAIITPSFTDEQILAQVDAALTTDPQEKVVVFACNWCSYAGADQAGIEKIQYPPSARIIRTMCSGRVDQKFVTRAFDRGAGAVLITGCRLTEKGSDCHYINANQTTLKRFGFWKKRAEKQGISSERFQLQWISASEGREFAAKMREMHDVVRRYNETRAATKGGPSDGGGQGA